MRAFEEVDLARRLRRHGRLVTLRPPVLSSARRFERGGPVRRTLQDLWLVAKYLTRPEQFAGDEA